MQEFEDNSVNFEPEDLAQSREGWWPAKIVGAWKRPTSVGSKAIKVKFAVEQVGHAPCTAWDSFVIEGLPGREEGEAVARQRLARLVGACGLDIKGRSLELDELIGRKVRVRIVLQTFRGQERAKIHGYLPIATSEGKIVSTSITKAVSDSEGGYKSESIGISRSHGTSGIQSHSESSGSTQTK